VVRVDLLEESLEVVCRWPHLAFDNVSSNHNILHVKVVHFLIIIIVVIIVNRSYNPLRAPLLPLLATLGVLLGTLDGDVGWRCVAATGDCFPASWDRERSGCLLVGGVLVSDVEQLLGGVPKNGVRYLEGRWLLRVTHITPGCPWSWSLRTTTVSLSDTVPTLAWVMHTTFMLHAHVPLETLWCSWGSTRFSRC
jgi:hypothetical protein